MPHPKNGKKQLDLQMWNFMSNLLKNKIIKIKYSRRLLDPENCCCGNHQPQNFFFGFFRFPDTCRQLRKTKIGRIEADELAVTGEKVLRLSQKERFLHCAKNHISHVLEYYRKLKKTMQISSSHQHFG